MGSGGGGGGVDVKFAGGELPKLCKWEQRRRGVPNLVNLWERNNWMPPYLVYFNGISPVNFGTVIAIWSVFFKE